MSRLSSIALTVLCLLSLLPLMNSGCSKSGDGDKGREITSESEDARAAPDDEKKGKKTSRKKKSADKKDSKAKKRGASNEQSPANSPDDADDTTTHSGNTRDREAEPTSSASTTGDDESTIETSDSDPTPGEVAPSNGAPENGDRSPVAAPESGSQEDPGSQGTSLPRPPVLIPASSILSVSDLTQHLPERGWISYGPLQGQTPTTNFNSVVYRKVGSRQFVSLQVWDFEDHGQAVARWNELFATYPHTQELKDMFTGLVFYSVREEIHQLVFVAPARSMVLAVACSSQACDQTALYNLAQVAYGRVHRPTEQP